MNCLLDYAGAHDSNPDTEPVIKSVARMIASLLFAQGLSCVILLVPCLQVSADGRVYLWKIYLTRLSISMQSVTGLCWIIVGLIDDRMVKDGPDGHQRKTFGLLIVGFTILVLSSLALMFSFWPIDSSSAQCPTVGQRANSQEGRMQENLITEPLLARSEDHEDDILENGPAGTGDASINLSAEPLDEIEEAEESTSRVRGTRRLLKLAQPQVLYLYIGCITLLIRLPFSLCIPHFVSTTLVALTQGDFHKGRHEVFWLFLLGSIDAFLDFWCVFWFGYSNLRIVRGVRIDTFAAILRQDIGFFDKHTSGELASRLSSDCGAMASGRCGLWLFCCSEKLEWSTNNISCRRSHLVLPIQHRICRTNSWYNCVHDDSKSKTSIVCPEYCSNRRCRKQGVWGLVERELPKGSRCACRCKCSGPGNDLLCTHSNCFCSRTVGAQ